MENSLSNKISSAAFAFRGYNVTNHGKSPELLAHPAYGSILEGFLKQAGEICADATGKAVDLVECVRSRRPTSLDTYAEDISMIVAVELGHLLMLEEFFGIRYEDAQVTAGYSLGEISALIAGDVFNMEAMLMPILTLADDIAALAHDAKMGVVFSRGPEIDFAEVKRLCLRITSEAQGTIGISTYLSPNTFLIVGQGNTIERFKEIMHETLPKECHLRKNPHRWPPMHTPISRQKSIPNRAAVIMEKTPGGFSAPDPPILSCVTGDTSYNDLNSRDLLSRWSDHPQLLWNVVDKILACGVETVIHVGPEPNIFPATFSRLSNNIEAQLNGTSLASIGLRAVSRLVRRPWLTRLISSDATLLRAPFVEHVILEDWLLEQQFD